MVSAGDHERMPDKDASQEDEIDLTTNKKAGEFVLKQKHFDKIRKNAERHGSKVKYRSPIVEKYLGKKVKPEFKQPTNPIKNRQGSIGKKDDEPQTMNDLINMARSGQGNIGMGNKLRKKLQNFKG